MLKQIVVVTVQLQPAQGCASAGRLAALAALNGKLKLQKRQVNYQASTTHRGCQIKNI